MLETGRHSMTPRDQENTQPTASPLLQSAAEVAEGGTSPTAAVGAPSGTARPSPVSATGEPTSAAGASEAEQTGGTSTSSLRFLPDSGLYGKAEVTVRRFRAKIERG